MNKYVLFGIIILFITVMTFVMQSAEQTIIMLDSPDEINVDSLEGIWGFIRTFGRMMTFRLDALPNVINVPLTMTLWFMLGFIIIDILKGILPFTS